MTGHGRGRSLAVLSLLMALLTSCQTSPAPDTVPQAVSPYGEQATVTLVGGRRFRGELLALSDTAWIFMMDRKVAMGRIRGVQSVELNGVGVITYVPDHFPSEKQLNDARRRARFPYGISPAVMAALLAKTSQASPDDLEAMP